MSVDFAGIIVPTLQCIDSQHLDGCTRAILDHGGEGTVLRKPGSFYSPGRSDELFKVKVCCHTLNANVMTNPQNQSQRDAEGLVTAVTTNEGGDVEYILRL